tara:strand:- start:2737 stop:3726 length:990 start_codon:yes stop_codon:yes gene_type:complete
MTFLPDSSLLVSDKIGKIWKIENNGLIKKEIRNAPKVLVKGQGGLLDIEVHPDFIKNNFVYISFTNYLEKNPRKTFTSIIRAKLENDELKNHKIIFRAESKFYSKKTHHYGSRIIFDNEHYIYFSIGDRGDRDQAQDLRYPNGKIHRLEDDGKIPIDNPFVNMPNAIPSIWTFGNRNPQGLSKHPMSNQIWSSEHGPKGGDELNIIKKGKNYGWPIITYGKNYSGTSISKLTHKKGMEQPIYHWTPSIALCGIKHVENSLFKKWGNDILVSSLKYEQVHKIRIKNNKVIDEEIIYDAGSRVRDIEIGPAGYIYIALENPGRIIKLRPID